MVSNELDSLTDNVEGVGVNESILPRLFVSVQLSFLEDCFVLFCFFIGQQDLFSGSEALNQVEPQL